jgi:hypothetical protein
MKALTLSLKKSRMRKKSYKTVNLTKINIAHREACAKHPKFCDEITNKSNNAVRKTLVDLRIENAEGPYFADRILHEEIAETLEAYLDGDLKHCLQELAQCGAVILRMMQFVQDEMEA